MALQLRSGFIRLLREVKQQFIEFFRLADEKSVSNEAVDSPHCIELPCAGWADETKVIAG